MQKIKLEALEAATREMSYLMSMAGYYIKDVPLTVLLFFNLYLGCFLLAYSVYYFANVFEKFADAFYNLILSIACVTVASTGWVCKEQFHQLVNGSSCTYDYRSPIMRTKLDEVEREVATNARKLFKGFIYMMCASVSVINFFLLVEAYFKNEDVYLLIPCWFPFQVSNVPLQILVLLWQETVVLNHHFLAFGGMAVLYTAYSNIKTQVILLRYAMKNIRPRALEMARNSKGYRIGNLESDEILSRCYYECTKMCAQHHSDIATYFHTVSTGCGMIYTAAFFTGVLAVSFGGSTLVSDDFGLAFKYMVLVITVLSMMYGFFWMGDATTYDLLKVAQTAYTMDWYSLPKNCQSTIRLMQLYSNKPLFYKMVFGQRVDREAYMALVKAAYYYINVLMANNDEQ